MARYIMTLEILAQAKRRLHVLRLLGREGRAFTNDQVMREWVGKRNDPTEYAAERSRARSALRDLRHAGWVDRGEGGWRITAAGREALAHVDALQAAA